MLNSIMENLRAMGANPETVTSATGETIIKINAPLINGLKMEINNKKYFIPPETMSDFEITGGHENEKTEN